MLLKKKQPVNKTNSLEQHLSMRYFNNTYTIRKAICKIIKLYFGVYRP